jgi:hypothetical protein
MQPVSQELDQKKESLNGKNCLNPVSEQEDLQYKMATVIALR